LLPVRSFVFLEFPQFLPPRALWVSFFCGFGGRETVSPLVFWVVLGKSALFLFFLPLLFFTLCHPPVLLVGFYALFFFFFPWGGFEVFVEPFFSLFLPSGTGLLLFDMYVVLRPLGTFFFFFNVFVTFHSLSRFPGQLSPPTFPNFDPAFFSRSFFVHLRCGPTRPLLH